MRFLYHSSYGSDDPTRATLAFMFARGALEAGHQAEIFLMGEASYLLRGAVNKGVKGVGVPPLSELLGATRDAGIPIFV